MSIITTNNFPAASLPLSGTESVPIWQAGTQCQTSPANIANAAIALTRPAGAASLSLRSNIFNFVPQLSDVSFTNTGTTKLYNNIFGSSGGDASHYTTSNGFLAMTLTGSDGRFATNLATQMPNSLPGTLPYLPGNQGFYVEAKLRMSTWSSDTQMAFYLMPQQHDAVPSDVLIFPYGPQGANVEGWYEIDILETAFGSYQQPTCSLIDHHGIFSGLPSVASASQTVANPGVFTTASQAYTANLCVYITGNAPGSFANNVPYFCISPTSTTTRLATTPGGTPIQCTVSSACTLVPSYQNLVLNSQNTPPPGLPPGVSAGLPQTDFTVAHRLGLAWNPAALQFNWWLDDNFLYTATCAKPAQIIPYNLYAIFACLSQGAHTPYTMEIQNLTAWTA